MVWGRSGLIVEMSPGLLVSDRPFLPRFQVDPPETSRRDRHFVPCGPGRHLYCFLFGFHVLGSRDVLSRHSADFPRILKKNEKPTPIPGQPGQSVQKNCCDGLPVDKISCCGLPATENQGLSIVKLVAVPTVPLSRSHVRWNL